MKKLLIIFTIAIIGKLAISQVPDSLYNMYNKAAEAYKNNNYDTAIILYNKILATDYEAPEVYYNLGNAYFKENDIAHAILNYERALKLKPSDDDAKNNLKYANLFVKDEFNNVPVFIFDRIYRGIVHIFSSNTWAVISIASFILALSLFMIFLFSKIISRRKIAFFGSILLIFISLTGFAFSAQMKNYFTKPNEAIIMQISTIKSSPEEDGTDLFILNPGIKVEIKDQTNDWYEVRLPNGKIGWIKTQNVEVI